MFDSETRWFIRCDTCPEPDVYWSERASDKDLAVFHAREQGWQIRDALHRCPDCVREGRTEMAS